jgi:TRAP-type C4-dicarboxylate transport system permease small subunit
MLFPILFVCFLGYQMSRSTLSLLFKCLGLTMCFSLLSLFFSGCFALLVFFFFFFELDSALSCHYGLKVYFLFIFSVTRHDCGISRRFVCGCTPCAFQ